MESNVDIEWFYVDDSKRKGPFGESEIIELIKSNIINRDTLVWNKEYNDWVKIIDTPFKNLFDTPPPLKGANVSNSKMWLLAFVPLIDSLIYYSTTDWYSDALALYFVWISSVILCIADYYSIKKAGYHTSSLVLWLLILIPVYIWKRSTLLNQKRWYFFVYLLMIIFSYDIVYYLFY